MLFWEALIDEDGNAFPPSRVNAFMEATYDYMLTARDPNLGDPHDGYRLVQQWAWFSTTDTSFNGTLFDPDTYAPTEMGSFFADYTSGIASAVDFYPRQNSVTMTLQATVANSGNLAKPTMTTVRFYDGDPQNGGTQIGPAQYVGLSGCGDRRDVSVQWVNAPVGTHPVYVLVSTPGGTLESNTDNNLAVGQIVVSGPQTVGSAAQRALSRP